MKSDTNTTRRRFIQASGVALTGLGGAGLATTTTSAETEPNGPDGILADGLEDSFDRSAFARGYMSRYDGGYGPPDTLESIADNARNEFDANDELWVDYGNWLLETADVVALGTAEIGVTFDIGRGRWPLSDPEPIETTIHAEYDDTDDEFTALEWRAEPADDPTYEFTLENRAAENAYSELQSFRREFIDETGDGDHELPPTEYLNELAGRYYDVVRLGADERSVIELLLGEVDV